MQDKRGGVMSEVLFSSPSQSREKDERYTPRWVFEALGETFDLDPCSPVGVTTAVPATGFYTKEDDGLLQPWRGFVWVNPPFSNATPWADKFQEHGNGIWLGPVAHSNWFQRLAGAATVIWLMRDFPFWHTTHAGKRTSMPLGMIAHGDRAAAAVTRASKLLPDAGVLCWIGGAA